MVEFGKRDEAVKTCRDGIRACPDARHLHEPLARILQDRGQLDEAITEWRATIDPTKPVTHYPDSHIAIGKCLWVKGNKDEAKKEWETLLNAAPQGYHADQLKTLIERGADAKSLALPAPVIAMPAQTPGTPSAAAQAAMAASEKVALADATWRKGDRDGAMLAYREALALDPNNTAAHLGLGTALFFAPKYPEAEVELRKAVAVVPDNPEANYRLGVALCSQRKYVEALSPLTKAVSLMPTDVGYRRQYIHALINAGKHDEAVADARSAMTAFPKSLDIHLDLAQALESKGDNDAALSEYRKCLEGQTGSTLAYVRRELARFYGSRDNNEAAISEYRKALQAANDAMSQASDHHSIGLLLWKMGRKDEARLEWEECIKLDPKIYGPIAKQELERK